MQLQRTPIVIAGLALTLLVSMGGGPGASVARTLAGEVPQIPAERRLESWTPPPSRESSVHLETPDGITLEGIVVRPDTPTPPEDGFPVAVLLHSFGRSRDDLLPLADHLAAAGVASVVMDLRGHGSSTTRRAQGSGGSDKFFMAQSDASNALELSVLDAVHVLNQLKQRNDLDVTKTVVVGVGEGALVAGRLAARTRSVSGVVLVDPARQIETIDLDQELESMGSRPVLLVCSGLPASRRSARALSQRGNGEREVRCVDAFGDEEELLGYAREATQEVVRWVSGHW